MFSMTGEPLPFTVFAIMTLGFPLHAFAAAKECKGKPSCVIANTVKGKGSPVMENKAGWHHHVPSQEEYTQIMTDLDAAILNLKAAGR